MDIDQASLDLLRSYDWPGNVREIRNCIERAVLLSDGSVIRTGDISIQGVEPRTEKESGGNGGLSSLALNEKEIILDALKRNDWIQKDAAETLGISKRVIHYKIRKYGITHPRWLKNR